MKSRDGNVGPPWFEGVPHKGREGLEVKDEREQKVAVRRLGQSKDCTWQAPGYYCSGIKSPPEWKSTHPLKGIEIWCDYFEVSGNEVSSCCILHYRNTGSSSSATFQYCGLEDVNGKGSGLKNCCACIGGPQVKCSAAEPCNYGYCNYEYGEPICSTCPGVLGSTFSGEHGSGDASEDKLEKKLMAYMDCVSMCEECELCEGSTAEWRDTKTNPCMWYVKNDLPVSFCR